MMSKQKLPIIRSGCKGGCGVIVQSTNFYGGNGIVGAQVPLGAGLGFAHKYRKDGSIAMTLCAAQTSGHCGVWRYSPCSTLNCMCCLRSCRIT